MNYLKYLLVGVLFGFVLTKSEVISWFRIQEMFRFQDFHLYGVIGSAILVGMISIQVIKRFNLKDKEGNPISIPDKDPTQKKRYIIGGTLFGFGWALTGACPAPLFALVGSGITVFIVPILAALAGTYVYGAFRESLPH
ncbi:MAG: DUF6691 family protein [Cyclonatronaceae bacterium]